MLQTKGRSFEFGPFRLDAVKRLLLREGEVVPLPPKAFDTLLHLVENGGQVVEKGELMKALWPDSFVEEINLTVHISTLRKALGENPNEHRYIVTVPRRGYSFVANVSEANGHGTLNLDRSEEVSGFRNAEIEDFANDKNISSGSYAPANRHSASRLNLRAIIPALLLISATFAVFYFRLSDQLNPAKERERISSIAVLPFKTLSSDQEQYFGVGMADALITRLSNVNQIAVRPTGSILKYQEGDTDLQAIGRELGVDAILDGKIQRLGDRVRVTVQLINARDRTPIWGDIFDQSFTDIFAVQDSICERVVSALNMKLTSDERAILAKRYTNNSNAYQAYLKGRYHWSGRGEANLKIAIEYFKQAIELDPHFGLAYAGMADCYNLLSIYSPLPPDETYPRAKEAARKALENDDLLAEAHVSLAYAKMRYDWDWEMARKEFERALELNPNYPTAHHWYGEYLMLMGKFDEAIAEMQRARELDPLSLIISSDLGWALYYARRYDEAADQCRKTLEMNANFSPARAGLALVYEQKGMYEQALIEFKKAGESHNSRTAHLYTVSGNRDQTAKFLDTYKDMSAQGLPAAFSAALIYTALGEKDEAMRYLEQAYKNREENLIYLKIDPRFSPLSADPGFQSLLRRLGFDNRVGITALR